MPDARIVLGESLRRLSLIRGKTKEGKELTDSLSILQRRRRPAQNKNKTLLL